MAHPIYTVDNLRLYHAPVGPLVQFRAAPTSPTDAWRSLRAISIDGSPAHYLVGDVFRFDLYLASELVPHILKHEFDVAHPLPPHRPTPDAILALPDDVRRFLVHYMNGEPVNTALSYIGLRPDGAPRVITALSEARINVVRAATMRTDLDRYDREYRRSLSVADDARREYERALAADPAAIATLAAPPEPQYGVIERMTEEDYRRLERRSGTALDAGHGNIRWPFTKMEPDSRVVIPAALATRAQRAVHVYAARTKKRFRTMRDPRTGNLTVCRLDGLSKKSLDTIN